MPPEKIINLCTDYYYAYMYKNIIIYNTGTNFKT